MQEKICKYYMVDEDGTEKTCKYYPMFYFSRKEGKWSYTGSVGINTIKDMVEVIPKGTIEKLTGKKLTWKDEPVRLEF